MFQAELGRMMREQQQMDYRREARRAKRMQDEQPQPHRNGARGFMLLPFLVLTIASRLVMLSSHVIRH